MLLRLHEFFCNIQPETVKPALIVIFGTEIQFIIVIYRIRCAGHRFAAGWFAQQFLDLADRIAKLNTFERLHIRRITRNLYRIYVAVIFFIHIFKSHIRGIIDPVRLYSCMFTIERFIRLAEMFIGCGIVLPEPKPVKFSNKLRADCIAGNQPQNTEKYISEFHHLSPVIIYCRKPFACFRFDLLLSLLSAVRFSI